MKKQFPILLSEEERVIWMNQAKKHGFKTLAKWIRACCDFHCEHPETLKLSWLPTDSTSLMIEQKDSLESILNQLRIGQKKALEPLQLKVQQQDRELKEIQQKLRQQKENSVRNSTIDKLMDGLNE